MSGSEVEVSSHQKVVKAKGLPKTVFEFHDGISGEEGHGDFDFVGHHARNSDKKSALRVIVRTEIILIHQLIIKHNNPLFLAYFIVERLFVIPHLIWVENSHTERNLFFRSVIQMKIELILMLIFELDDESFLLSRVERLVVSDASVETEFVVGSRSNQSEMHWV